MKCGCRMLVYRRPPRDLCRTLLASKRVKSETGHGMQQNGVEVNMGEWEVSGAAQIGGKLYMSAPRSASTI